MNPSHLYNRNAYTDKTMSLCWDGPRRNVRKTHYDDVIMGARASQITSLTIVYSTVYSDADQRKHQSSASLAFVRGIHRGPVNSPHKWPVTREMSPFDDVITRSYVFHFYLPDMWLHKHFWVHWRHDKMAANLKTTFPHNWIVIHNSPTFIPRSPTENM